jgi:anti-sigma factor RsiW
VVTKEHETALLGAYVLGVLDDTELTRVGAHLDACWACRTEVEELRDVETVLGAVPAEAFIDGPPADGDLLLQRTLWQVRSDRGRPGALRRPRP